MAAGNNAVCKEFFSVLPQVSSSGLNIFCQKLELGKKYFCCPPVKLIVRVVGYLLQQTDVQVLLIVPAWESTPFWSVLQQHKDFQLSIKKQKAFWPRFLTFNSAPGSVFAKRPNMKMQAYLLKMKRCEL